MTPSDLFDESEKMMLAQISTSWGVSVHDQESFDDYIHTLGLALDHDEMTRILAMAVAVINSVSNGVLDKAAQMFVEMKAQEN